MTQDNPERYDLSRRKVLGGLTAVGVASVGAGLGTSAYFSDEESFDNNVLTAGSLDLRVDWEEHYSDWSDDESQGLQNEVVMTNNDPNNVPTDYVGLPDPEAPLIAVHSDDLGTFMDNTSVEAYPDSNDDGIQDDLANYDACSEFAQTPEDLDPFNDRSLRSMTDDAVNDFDEESYNPLVHLEDVKPGDFGELTLSFHLCDNPGYVWLTGGLVSASENGVTEPEGDDPDEESGTVELLDEVQTMLWYDEDGDNVFEPGGESGEADIVLVLDRSGSMSGSKITEAKNAAKNLVDAVGSGAQVGVVSFADQESLDHALSSDKASVKSAIDGISTGGSTNMEGGVNGAEEELTGADLSNEVTASGNARSSAQNIMVVLSDGAPNVDDNEVGGNDGNVSPVDEATRAKGNGIEIFTVGFGVSSGSSTALTLEDMASDPKDDHFFLGATGELQQIFGQIATVIAGEQVIFRGTLRETLNLLEGENIQGGSVGYQTLGLPLDGDRATDYPEVIGSPRRPNEGDHDGRECFVDSTTNAIGFAWWLPLDHGNEVQTDSVSFDIGFYTEQCRHNTGSGLAPESTPTAD